MELEVSQVIGAERGERRPDDRATHRNGYRSRRWDTRAGEIELQIPKIRQGSYFPSILEPRRRSEQALLAVVQQAYVCGVSTRRVDQLVERREPAHQASSHIRSRQSSSVATRVESVWRESRRMSSIRRTCSVWSIDRSRNRPGSCL